MAFQKITTLLALSFLLVACSAGTQATAVPTSSGVPVTAVPSPTESSPAKETPLNYKIVFDRGDFQIREAFLGSLDTWNWQSFSMPAARIPRGSGPRNFESDYDYERCYKEVKATGRCAITIKMAARKDQQPIKFDLVTNDMSLTGGHYLLRKNGRSVWEGDLFGGTWLAILGLARIDDELAIDTVITDSQKLHKTILLTQDNSAVDVLQATKYDAVFYPCELEGKLAYFAHISQSQNKDILIFDGQEVGYAYDEIFNQYCCWDGPPIQIASNGEVVDFFAERDNGWYHVQAGNLASLK